MRAATFLRFLHTLGRREISYCLRRPTNLLPFLTYRCSSRCRSCQMWRRVGGEEWTCDQWLRFLGSLNGSVRHVEPFGGDVMLRADVLFPMIEESARLGLLVDIPLNGVLITPAVAERLAALPINTIYVSVDGVGETHDNVRQVTGNCEHIAAAVGIIRRARGDRTRPTLAANTTVSCLNYHQCDAIAQFARDAGFDRVAFEYCGEFPPEAVDESAIDGVRPRPYYERQGESLLLSAAQAQRLKRDLDRLRCCPGAREAGADGFHVVTRNIDFLSVAEMVSGQPRISRCYVCRTLLTIDPGGNVLPCPFFDQYHLGNLAQAPLRHIWNNARHRRFVALQRAGKLPMCRYCILSVERNLTPRQALSKWYLTHTGRARW
jgi:MoaA/NifB/PqqE/SkfB family radical SAM enzyme